MMQGTDPKMPTMGGLVGLVDQLAAATVNVQDAWFSFIHGSSPVAKEASLPPPINPDDVIRFTDDSLRTQVARLQELAQEIHSRA